MTAGKVWVAVVTAKVAVVMRMLEGMASLPLASEEAFLADPRMVAAGESYLRRALEALFDLGRHLLAKAHGIPGAEYKEVAQRLGEHGLVTAAHAARLVQMAGYRNRLVHFYDEGTPVELYRILSRHRDDILSLTQILRAWVSHHPELVDDSL